MTDERSYSVRTNIFFLRSTNRVFVNMNRAIGNVWDAPRNDFCYWFPRVADRRNAIVSVNVGFHLSKYVVCSEITHHSS